MKLVIKLFLKGLAAVLPFVLTLYLLYWLGASAEQLLGGLLKHVLPQGYYVPGMGVIAGFVAMFAAGILTTSYIVKAFLHLGEDLVERIPVVKTIYNAIKDVIHLISGDEKRQLGEVVLVRWGDLNTKVLGFVTRDSVADIRGIDGDSDLIAVYLPMSYQIGGFTVFVSRREVEPIDMSAEDALRFAVTAGMSGGAEG